MVEWVAKDSQRFEEVAGYDCHGQGYIKVIVDGFIGYIEWLYFSEYFGLECLDSLCAGSLR